MSLQSFVVLTLSMLGWIGLGRDSSGGLCDPEQGVLVNDLSYSQAQSDVNQTLDGSTYPE